MAVKKLTRDELVTALRCCEDEDCMRCPVAYQPGSLCRGDLESQAADMLENHETERLALVKEIEKMRKQVEELTKAGMIATYMACIQVGDVRQINTDDLCGQYDAARIAEMERANRELGINLRMALDDMKQLDACEICKYWDGGCTAPKDITIGGSCFVWRRCAT